MIYFKCTPDGLIYNNTVYIGCISRSKYGEKWLTLRDGYALNSQVLLELKHLVDEYGGVA